MKSLKIKKIKSIKSILFWIMVICVCSNLTLQAQWNLPTDVSNEIDASISIGENIHFFKDGKLAIYGEDQSKSIASIGNWPDTWPGITAAVQWDENTAFLFSGSSYLSLDISSYSITGGDIWGGLPPAWGEQFDAAVDWSTDEIFFFHNDYYVIYNKVKQEYSMPQSLQFWGMPRGWDQGIDATLNAGNGSIYFFRGGAYTIYDQSTRYFSEVMPINEGASLASTGSIPPPGGGANKSIRPVENNFEKVQTSNEVISSQSQPSAHPKEVMQEAHEENLEEDNPALSIRPTGPFPDEYRDDYKAFTSQLMNITWGAATSGTVRPLAAKNWLGTGVDILYVDPLRVNKSKRAPKSAIIMTDSDQLEGNASEFIIPFGTKFESIGQGDTKTSKRLLKTYGEFTTTFGGSIGGDISVPMVASGSNSSSYKQMNSSKFGTEKVYGYKQAYNELYKVRMDLDWIDNHTNQKYRQKLDKGFRNMVNNLKVPSSMPSFEMPSKKGDKLPSSLNAVKSSYKSLMTSFGTHITNAVTYGGRFISLYEINRSTYESARMTQANFESAAAATIKGITIGFNASFEYQDQRRNEKTSSNFSETSYVTGGSGTTFDTWESKITDAPAPIELELAPLYDLLTKIYFPNDPDIEKKAEILKAVILEYVCSKMTLPVDVDLTGNNFFKELKPLEYDYEVTIDYLKCIKVNSDEPGSENEYFGYMSFASDNEITNAWNRDEDSPIGLQAGAEMPIRLREPYIVTLAKGKQKTLEINAHLYEEDTDYGAFGDDDDLGKVKKIIKLHEIGNQPKSFFLDFAKDGDQAEFKITISRSLKVETY